jgi:N-acetylmuramic acid 6-phosphate (MurNAc-6-P) etherase
MNKKMWRETRHKSLGFGGGRHTFALRMAADDEGGCVALLQTPVTELSNELTSDLDAVDSVGFVRLLRQCDAQIFSGWRHFPGLFDAAATSALERLVFQSAEALLHPQESTIVLSGCGTSGRVAFLLARAMNSLLAAVDAPPCFQYLISGGDAALLMSEELPEDDPVSGARELERAVGRKSRVVFVGITCGLSAPYVAGQLDWCLARGGDTTTVLLGFNPTRLARAQPIELWNGRTFREVVERMELQRGPRCMVINPVVGPEAVTGSSRMKGGSATGILLATAFTRAFARRYAATHPALCNGPAHHASLVDTLSVFETVARQVYLQTPRLAELVEQGGNSLRKGGHIYYLGAGTAGVLGFVDASEMPDTYGTPHTEVRAFVADGWRTMGNVTGDLSNQHPLFRISLADFESAVLPGLRDSDTVVGLTIDGEAPSRSVAQAVEQTLQVVESRHAASVWRVLVRNAHNDGDKDDEDEDDGGLGADAVGDDSKSRNRRAPRRVTVALPSMHLLSSDFLPAAFAVKLVANAITTGANVRNGLVLRNRMINMTVANNKLYHRAIGIVAEFAQVSAAEAENALLRTIYNDDGVSSLTLRDGIAARVTRATAVERVIPTAIMVASSQVTVAEARQLLVKERNVRAALERQRSVAGH